MIHICPNSSKSNSELNLNWNKLEPTSTIYTLSSSPHALLNVSFAAFLLKGFHVRNLPIRLRVQLSISNFLPSSEMFIVSSSSPVNFIFSKQLITSSTITSQGHNTLWVRTRDRNDNYWRNNILRTSQGREELVKNHRFNTLKLRIITSINFWVKLKTNSYVIYLSNG